MCLRDRSRRPLELAEKMVVEVLPRDYVEQVAGTILCKLGSVDEGLDRLRSAMRLRPSRQNTAAYVQQIDEVPDHHEEAMGLYLEMLALNDKDQFALLGLGMMYLRMGEPSQAEPLLLKALKQNPQDPIAQYEIGNMLCDQEHYEEAVPHYLAALKHDYWMPQWCWGNLAYCYQKADRLEDAADAIEKALALDPEAEKHVNLREEIVQALNSRGSGAGEAGSGTSQYRGHNA